MLANVKHSIYFRLNTSIQSCVMIYGASSYALYWVLVEMIHEQKVNGINYVELDNSFIETLNKQINFGELQIFDVINHLAKCGVFKIIDDKLFLKGEKMDRIKKQEDLSKYTDAQISSFKKFNEYIQNNAPLVAKMKYPFTIKEMISLKENYSIDYITTMLSNMHNYKPLLKNNVDAFLTFSNWAKKDFNKSSTPINKTASENIKKLLDETR